MKQKLTALVMALLLACSVCTISVSAKTGAIHAPLGGQSASGDGPIGITPYWTHIASISNTLTISGNTATCKFYMAGYSTCKKSSVTAYLQRKSGSSWVTQAMWSIPESSAYLNATRTASLSTKGEYRLYSVFYAYNSSGSAIESVERYSYANY